MVSRPLLCDTGVFVSHRDREPSLQRIPAIEFFNSVKNCHYHIFYLEDTLYEMKNKFEEFFNNEFTLLMGELKQLEKITRIQADDADKKGIYAIKKCKFARDVGLSYVDCSLAYFAKKKNLPVVCLEGDLTDYCMRERIEVFTPEDLIVPEE